MELPLIVYIIGGLIAVGMIGYVIYSKKVNKDKNV